MEEIILALIEHKLITGFCIFLLILTILETLAKVIEAKSGPLFWLDRFLTTFVESADGRMKRLYRGFKRLFNKNKPN
jgi:hypothetical protein